MGRFGRAGRAGMVPLAVGAVVVVLLSMVVATPASASSDLRFLAYYEFINGNSQSQPTLQCLATPNHSAANGTKEIQWPCSGSSDQVWYLYLDNGYFNRTPSRTVYELKNLSSGKCLADPGASQTHGVQMIQWTCNNGDEQRWEQIIVSADVFKLRNVSSGYCLAVTGGSHANGAAIIQWDCSNGLEQQWSMHYEGG